ncbi:MAG: L,D-transpeptidase [Myxococcales bacterium]|nr:L,D-transpeptidase [Polyangiaceae bacterium]MDW8251989.1 L,D-transpeptidase [Myxococcales bacterium]
MGHAVSWTGWLVVGVVLASCGVRGASPAPPLPMGSTERPAEGEADRGSEETLPSLPGMAEESGTTPSGSASVVSAFAPAARAELQIGSVQRTAWIFDRPSKQGRQIGYLREGTAAPLASPEPVQGVGCPGGWYGLVPTGYVCLDRTTTLDLRSPRFLALAEAAPRNEEVLPYRYAFSKGAPMYNRIPTPEEQQKVEGPPEKRKEPPPLSRFLSGHEELAMTEGIQATDEVPEGWKEGAPVGAPRELVRKWIPHGSMLAFHAAFQAQGRVWLLSPDMTVVPADRMKPFRVSTFRGVKLEGDAKLPLAWSRHDPVQKYRKEADGVVATEERWPPRTAIPLTGERVEQGGKVYLVTQEEGILAREDQVVVASAREKDKMPASMEAGQRWIDVHIRAGTLTAYVGERPVFTTLVSPGAGGYGAASESNAALVKRSATPLGVYRVTWKTRAAVMSPEDDDPKKFWIADVPHTLYFRPPFAIHTAYWHEDFGMPKSAGCINVSPEDGRFLYDWTDPPTPPGWQGSGPGKGMGLGTLLVIAP